MKSQRNADITQAIQRGENICDVAKTHNISRQRVWQIVNPKIQAAHSAIQSAVRSKRIPVAKTLSCKDCGGPAKEYDHPNYNKPLAVDPVCKKCHEARGVSRSKTRSQNKDWLMRVKPYNLVPRNR